MRDLPVRKHPRLKGYDYNQNGAYFITFCVKDRHEILGNVVGRDAPGAPFVELSDSGKAVCEEIEKTQECYGGVVIDKYVVMPNHVHIIVFVDRDNGAPGAARPTNALIPTIVTIIKRKTNKAVGFAMWQDSYHDHIIHSEDEYQRIWQYIDENPMNWQKDRYFVEEAPNYTVRSKVNAE